LNNLKRNLNNLKKKTGIIIPKMAFFARSGN